MSDMSGMSYGCAADAESVFGKTYTCPVCNEEFKCPTIKSSKVRVIGSDVDLRPIYEKVNALKYDVVLCSHCGYTALSRYFSEITQVQKKLIQEKICSAYRSREEGETFSYEDALRRYKMALLNCITKRAPESEKAYVCLKSAWLLRSWRESLEGTGNEAKEAQLAKSEEEYLKNAKEGFEQANMKEDYPICGMDENTVDYLIAALSVRFGEYDVALKILSGVIVSRTVNVRVKDRARDLKDEIVKRQKEQGRNE